ncbi:MAG: hypothetical protein AB1696_06690 [Planctomycetota bacterium]
MRTWACWVALFVAIFGVACVYGDVILLKNGSRFEGKIRQETPEKIVMEMQFGTMEFPRDQIKEIAKKALPPAPQAKPPAGAEPADKETPEKAAPAAAGETRGKITVAQKMESATKSYVMDIKDAVAIFYKDDPNKMIEVSFMPFKLSEGDLKKLRDARGNEVFALVGSKPTPNKTYWENRCPYAFIKIKFEQGKEPGAASISECQIVFYQFTYSSESATDTWEGAKARLAVPKFNLSMGETEGATEGALDLSFVGRMSIKREISFPAQDHSYMWNIEAKCKVFVK